MSCWSAVSNLPLGGQAVSSAKWHLGKVLSLRTLAAIPHSKATIIYLELESPAQSLVSNIFGQGK